MTHIVTLEIVLRADTRINLFQFLDAATNGVLAAHNVDLISTSAMTNREES